MEKKNLNNGITLIALVITIIVLLILAGVAINLAMDSNGLFAKANEAVRKWNTSVAEEDRIMQNILEQMNEINGETTPEITPKLTLSEETGEIEVEKTLVLTASLNVTATQNIVWSSSDNSIATVVGSGTNNITGTITGVKAGTVTITATYGDKTATCSVTVKEKEVEVQEDELAGTWVFNDIISPPVDFESSYDLNFEIDGDDSYVNIGFNGDDTYFALQFNYEFDGTFEINTVYGRDFTSGESGWAYDEYKEILITTKLSEMEKGEEFLTWLRANATKQN